MDGISNQIIAIASQMQSARLAQSVQIYVLHQAMDMQQTSVQTLLQPSPIGPQPLASSGSLGTRFNALA